MKKNKKPGKGPHKPQDKSLDNIRGGGTLGRFDDQPHHDGKGGDRPRQGFSNDCNCASCQKKKIVL